MASLYKKQRSPFWWIKYRSPVTGEIVRESTKFRIGVGPDTRRAQQLKAEKTLIECDAKPSRGEEWNHWVTAYLRLRYAGSPKTELRAAGAWRTIQMYLKEKQVSLPRNLTRSHCVDYMSWRTKPNKQLGKYRAGHNTAHLELKFLGIIMAEAVLRGYAPYNPCRDLEIHRKRGTQKPELTDSAIEMILKGIETQPEPKRTFFHRSFLFGLLHGARISETYFNPQEALSVRTVPIDGKAQDMMLISFATKGNKVHTVPVHPDLVPTCREMLRTGAKESYELPKSPAKEWHNFLKRIGVKAILPGACFHSTRVTCATRLARASVSERKAMSYVGHASTTVHRVYIRLRAEDLAECSDALSFGGIHHTNTPSGDKPAPPGS